MLTNKLALGTLVIFVVAFFFSSTASASYMTYNGMGYKQTVTIYNSSFSGGHITTSAGEMLINYEGQDYISYCVDIYQSAGSSSVTEEPVSYLDNGPRNDGDMAAYLYLTFGDVRTGTETEKKNKAAALQIAIWEVIFEKDNKSYNLEHGDIHFSASDAVMNLAQNYLDSLPDNFDGSGALVLKSNYKQDMIIPTAVPEPTTIALLGIGGIATLLRRRRIA